MWEQSWSEWVPPGHDLVTNYSTETSVHHSISSEMWPGQMRRSSLPMGGGTPSLLCLLWSLEVSVVSGRHHTKARRGSWAPAASEKYGSNWMNEWMNEYCLFQTHKIATIHLYRSTASIMKISKLKVYITGWHYRYTRSESESFIQTQETSANTYIYGRCRRGHMEK